LAQIYTASAESTTIDPNPINVDASGITGSKVDPDGNVIGIVEVLVLVSGSMDDRKRAVVSVATTARVAAVREWLINAVVMILLVYE
jgi:hypothetical protein